MHAFTDGRDVSPHAAVVDIATLPADRIATVVGRYYAMDRDKRWERTDRALAAIVEGRASRPTTRGSGARELRARRDGRVRRADRPPRRPRFDPARDTAIVFNFRPDRVRQLTQRLLGANADVVTMTRYATTSRARRVRRADGPGHARAGAEPRRPEAAPRRRDEKYAHVTYFFDGGVEEPWDGEERILIPSPRDVRATT